MTREEIIEILNKYKESVKIGSDGDYTVYKAVMDDDFNDVANDIIYLQREVTDEEIRNAFRYDFHPLYFEHNPTQNNENLFVKVVRGLLTPKEENK